MRRGAPWASENSPHCHRRRGSLAGFLVLAVEHAGERGREAERGQRAAIIGGRRYGVGRCPQSMWHAVRIAAFARSPGSCERERRARRRQRRRRRTGRCRARSRVRSRAAWLAGGGLARAALLCVAGRRRARQRRVRAHRWDRRGRGVPGARGEERGGVEGSTSLAGGLPSLFGARSPLSMFFFGGVLSCASGRLVLVRVFDSVSAARDGLLSEQFQNRGHR